MELGWTNFLLCHQSVCWQHRTRCLRPTDLTSCSLTRLLPLQHQLPVLHPVCSLPLHHHQREAFHPLQDQVSEQFSKQPLKFVFRTNIKFVVRASAETRMWGSDRLSCWLPRGQQVSHQRWISRNIYNVCLCQVQIRLPTLALKPGGDVIRSPKQGYQRPHKKDVCPSKKKI